MSVKGEATAPPEETPSESRKGLLPHAVETKERVVLGHPVDRFEGLGVRLGPDALDGEPAGVDDVVRAFHRVGPGDHQDPDLLRPQIGQPGVIVGMDAVPSRPWMRPGRLSFGTGGAVVVVQQPMAMGIDIDVANVVAQAQAHQVIGQIRPGVGDAGPRRPGAEFELNPARHVVAEIRVEEPARVDVPGRRRGDGQPSQDRGRGQGLERTPCSSPSERFAPRPRPLRTRRGRSRGCSGSAPRPRAVTRGCGVDPTSTGPPRAPAPRWGCRRRGPRGGRSRPGRRAIPGA